MKKTLIGLIGLILAGINLSVTAEEADDQLAIAGKLELDYHAEFMAARDPDGHVVNWNNCGVFKGGFGDFGFDGPRETYPAYRGDLDGSPAVAFDGSDRLRHYPFPTPTSIWDNTLSVEVWANELGQEGTIVAWGDFKLKPSDFGKTGAGWQHLAVVVKNGTATWYRNGTDVKHAPIPEMTPGQIILGEGLSGSLAALRVHTEALTAEQLQHNLQGGVLLGTKLCVNIDSNALDDVHFGDPDRPQFETKYSHHFRSTWEPAKDEKQVMETRVPEQLEQAERHYEVYEQLGYHMPIVSADANLRGDGRKYKIPLGNDWNLEGGGGWMGWTGRGFGFAIAGPGRFSGHELGHGTQGHQITPMEGNFWEVHTSWLPRLAEPLEKEPIGVFMSTGHLFPGNGRNYYHSWQIFDHLAELPEYGPLFITKMWNTLVGGEKERKYPWLTGEKIDPDPSTPFRDECVKMARRFITWDFETNHEGYLKGAEEVDLDRYRTVLEPITYQPGWYRVPRALAPLQWGFNICPLTIDGADVTADLQGYVNPERGSHWSASFVAVQADGSPRYSEVWNQGELTFPIKEDDKELYLVVAATPTKIAPLGTCGNYRSPDWHQFPFKVKLTGTEPREVLTRAKPEVGGAPHSNGGGFVAETATVDESAYVGPQALVLSNAQVLGNARIEDQAVVFGTVKDTAVISDFAVVEQNTTVRGNAKLRNRTIAGGGCEVSGDAKVLENASVIGNSTKVSGNVTVKGYAVAYGGNVRGTAILDGHYAKANDIDKGCWFTWSWATGQNDGEVDKEFGGIYCRYTFETNHPYLAWDEHGVTWGYLVNNPQVAKIIDDGMTNAVLTLNGANQFVELQPDVADMRDITISADLLWTGNPGATLFSAEGRNGEEIVLTPCDDKGGLAFSITIDGETRTVRSADPLPSGRWVNLQLMLGEELARVLVDGIDVARNETFSFNPDDLRAKAVYLGRGIEGGYFQGCVDNFTIYGLALEDSVAPTPNPLEWLFAPEMPSPDTVVMHAVEASDPRGVVEYRFIETSGNASGLDSGWQKEATFIASNLQQGIEYEFEAIARDVNGNETEPAQRTKVKWHHPPVYRQDDTDAGTVVFEAEQYAMKSDGPEPWKWEQVNDVSNCTQGETAMMGLPDTGIQYTPFFGPRMDYYLELDQPGTYWLWLRASGPHWRGDSVNIAFDYLVNQQAPFIDMGVDKFRWVRYNQPITVTRPGVHVLTLWMREDGTMLDRMLLTNQENYRPTDELDSFNAPVGIGPAASTRSE